MSTVFLSLESTPSSASSAEGFAPMSISTSPTVVHYEGQNMSDHPQFRRADTLDIELG